MFDTLRGFAHLIRNVRQDGWENVFTGLGTSRDKTTYGYFRGDYRISEQELTDLFNHHDLARRIVALRPAECYREGFKVEVKDNTDQQEVINKAIKERGLVNQFRRATVFGRLRGGGLIIGGLDDGQAQDQPLQEDRIQRLRYLTWLDKRYVTVRTWYEDPESEKFMEPETYQICAPGGKILAAVHETRCIRFGGAETDEETARSLGGWDFSVLQNCYNTMRAFENKWQAVDHLLSDASQAVFRIKGLINTLATPNGMATMQTRMELIDMARSVARAVVLDADYNEDFKREATNFANIAEILDRGMMRLAAAAETPVSLLFGRSAAGMNATGEGDFQGFYDSVKAEQTKEVDPKVRRVVTWICKSKDGPTGGKVPDFDVCFPPLWQPNPKDQATTEKTYAERDNVMITAQVWLPEEVALARAKGGPNGPVEIDENMRKAALKAEKELANDPNAQAQKALQGQEAPGGGQNAPVPGGGNANDKPGDPNPEEDPGEDPSED